MGSRGGNAPNAYQQRKASTLFLRVPSIDWARVRVGEKTEFRTMPRSGTTLFSAYTPTPVVAYTVNRLGETDSVLMVLEERRLEPLFMVSQSAESLTREGFETYDLFRRYMRKRTHGIYRPSDKMWAWRVRLFDYERDAMFCGEQLFLHLYGEFV